MSARHRAAPFVYLGVEPRAVEGAAEMQLVDYAIKVLDALKWRWGPAHIEVMQTAVRPETSPPTLDFVRRGEIAPRKSSSRPMARVRSNPGRTARGSSRSMRVASMASTFGGLPTAALGETPTR